MLHEPAQDNGQDLAAEYKSRLGVNMFVYYLLMYIGFVVINLYDPGLMEAIVLFGMNLATVYGMGLIIVALVMALIYDYKCTAMERLLAAQASEGGDE